MERVPTLFEDQSLSLLHPPRFQKFSEVGCYIYERCLFKNNNETNKTNTFQELILHNLGNEEEKSLLVKATLESSLMHVNTWS